MSKKISWAELNDDEAIPQSFKGKLSDVAAIVTLAMGHDGTILAKHIARPRKTPAGVIKSGERKGQTYSEAIRYDTGYRSIPFIETPQGRVGWLSSETKISAAKPTSGMTSGSNAVTAADLEAF